MYLSLSEIEIFKIGSNFSAFVTFVLLATVWIHWEGSLGEVVEWNSGDLRFGSVQHLDLQFLRLTKWCKQTDGPKQTHWNYRNRPGVFTTQRCIWFLGVFEFRLYHPTPLIQYHLFPMCQNPSGLEDLQMSAASERRGETEGDFKSIRFSGTKGKRQKVQQKAKVQGSCASWECYA